MLGGGPGNEICFLSPSWDLEMRKEMEDIRESLEFCWFLILATDRKRNRFPFVALGVCACEQVEYYFSFVRD